MFRPRCAAIVGLLTVRSQTELVLNTHTIVSRIDESVTNTHTLVSGVDRNVTDTHTMVSGIDHNVANTHTIVSDIHHIMVKSQEAVDGKNTSVSITCTLFTTE